MSMSKNHRQIGQKSSKMPFLVFPGPYNSLTVDWGCEASQSSEAPRLPIRRDDGVGLPRTEILISQLLYQNSSIALSRYNQANLFSINQLSQQILYRLFLYHDSWFMSKMKDITFVEWRKKRRNVIYFVWVLLSAIIISPWLAQCPGSVG